MGTKVTFKTNANSYKALSNVMKSRKLGALLEEIAQPIMDEAKRDPNPTYVASLRMYQHVSSGSAGRVSVRIGAAPIIGSRVEAKRGTLARALGKAGF